MIKENINDPLGWTKGGVVADLITVCTKIAEEHPALSPQQVLSAGLKMLVERYKQERGTDLNGCGLYHQNNVRNRILEARLDYLDGLQYDIDAGDYEGINDCCSVRSATVLGLRDAVIYKLPLWMRKTVFADICVAYARGLLKDPIGKPPQRGWNLVRDMDISQKTVYCVYAMYKEKIDQLKRDIDSEIRLVQEMEIRFYSISKLLVEMVHESLAGVDYLQGFTWATGGIYYSSDRDAAFAYMAECRIDNKTMKRF